MRVAVDKADWLCPAFPGQEMAHNDIPGASGLLADQAAQLASMDPGWRQLADELRDWEATLRRFAIGDLTKFAVIKWNEFLLRVQSRIDSFHGLFPAIAEEAGDDT